MKFFYSFDIDKVLINIKKSDNKFMKTVNNIYLKLVDFITCFVKINQKHLQSCYKVRINKKYDKKGVNEQKSGNLVLTKN